MVNILFVPSNTNPVKLLLVFFRLTSGIWTHLKEFGAIFTQDPVLLNTSLIFKPEGS